MVEATNVVAEALVQLALVLPARLVVEERALIDALDEHVVGRAVAAATTKRHRCSSRCCHTHLKRLGP